MILVGDLVNNYSALRHEVKNFSFTCFQLVMRMNKLCAIKCWLENDVGTRSLTQVSDINEIRISDFANSKKWTE